VGAKIGELQRQFRDPIRRWSWTFSHIVCEVRRFRPQDRLSRTSWYSGLEIVGSEFEVCSSRATGRSAAQRARVAVTDVNQRTAESNAAWQGRRGSRPSFSLPDQVQFFWDHRVYGGSAAAPFARGFLRGRMPATASSVTNPNGGPKDDSSPARLTGHSSQDAIFPEKRLQVALSAK
jgi:hypothetical protein